ncbi:hypothetical protein A9R05_41385 (plasmid) [Burkholderia sp. KK1]|nr:hypothetical protein A9R05_41385 [Burkholderia sp. KK1]
MNASSDSFFAVRVARHFSEGENSNQVMSDGIAFDSEPLPAAERVSPALERGAANVLAREEVVSPLRIDEFMRSARTNALIRSAEGELVFVSGAAAVRTRNA